MGFRAAALQGLPSNKTGLGPGRPWYNDSNVDNDNNADNDNNDDNQYAYGNPIGILWDSFGSYRIPTGFL